VSWIARTPLQQLPRRPSVDERHYHDWMASIPTPNHQTTIAAVTARLIQKVCMNSPVTGDATRSPVDILTAGFFILQGTSGGSIFQGCNRYNVSAAISPTTITVGSTRRLRSGEFNS